MTSKSKTIIFSFLFGMNDFIISLLELTCSFSFFFKQGGSCGFLAIVASYPSLYLILVNDKITPITITSCCA